MFKGILFCRRQDGRFHRVHAQLGYTLPEVFVAMALVGLMVAVLFGGLTTATMTSKLSKEELRATEILLEKMEIVRSYTWNQFYPNIDPDEGDDDEGESFDSEDPDFPEDDIPFTIPSTFKAPFLPGASDNGGFEYTGKITVIPAPISEAYSNSLSEVIIQVQWNSGETVHTRQMRTFFAEFGLQNNLTR